MRLRLPWRTPWARWQVDWRGWRGHDHFVTWRNGRTLSYWAVGPIIVLRVPRAKGTAK